MDLIEDTSAVFFDDGFVGEKLAKDDAAVGAVKPSKAGGGIDLFFGF